MSNDGVKGPENLGRRRFLTATTAVVGAVGAGFVAVPFIKSWLPSAKAKLAGAPVTADISALQEGQRLVLEWRGQPIWIVKRSKQMLEVLPTLDPRLADPKSSTDQQPAYTKNELRSITSRASTWPAASSPACPRRSTCWCRRTTTKTTPRSSSVSIRRGPRKPWRTS
jgi:ubiquinol-cytochrome c reductase iron-sulfur subunit